MAKIRYNPIAVTDLQEIKEYISKDSETNAVKVVTKIVDSIDGLKEFPLLGTSLKKKIKIPTKYRYLVCHPYLILYICENDIVNIARILHEKRDYLSVLEL
jgi:addiction module RelE/StbE family toxin